MENGGNAKVNAVFEARLGSRKKPTNMADGPTRERFIRDKYERRKFYDPAALENYVPQQQEPETTSAKRSNKASRQPSEAARLRAESRRAAARGVVETPKAPAPKAAPPPPAAPEVDLLDFAAFDTTPAPAPVAAAPVAPPPAATPTSPNLDLFANMTVSDNNTTAAAPVTSTSPAQPARKTNDDILAMFSTPSQPNNNNMMGGASAVAMATPTGGMMMAAGGNMPTGVAATANPMLMPNTNGMVFPNMMQPQPNMVMMNGFGNTAANNTMYMQQQGNAMMMQQQGNNTVMVQKNGNTGNVMMMQQQGQPTMNTMQMMQQASNSDDFGFPQAPMGSGPPIAQNGGGYNAFTKQDQSLSPPSSSQQQASPNDPFAQFGNNVFR